jgi:hypothetical protein
MEIAVNPLPGNEFRNLFIDLDRGKTPKRLFLGIIVCSTMTIERGSIHDTTER